MTKTRTKKVAEEFGGSCEGKATSQEECNKQDCPSKLICVTSKLLYT